MPRRRPRRLEPTELDGLAQMFEAGMTAAEIGAHLGVSGNTVRRRLAQRGLRYRRRGGFARRSGTASEMRRGHIHLLRGQGRTLSQMALHLGLRLHTLRVWMGRTMSDLYAQMTAEERRRRPRRPPAPRAPRFVPRRTGRPGALRAKHVVRHYALGFSIRAIARHYDRHPQQIWRVLVAQGVARRPRLDKSPMWLRRHGQKGAR